VRKKRKSSNFTICGKQKEGKEKSLSQTWARKEKRENEGFKKEEELNSTLILRRGGRGGEKRDAPSLDVAS